MCDTYTPAGEPLPTNARYKAEKIFSHPDVVAEEPWYVLNYSFRVFHSCPTSLLFSLCLWGTIMFDVFNVNTGTV